MQPPILSLAERDRRWARVRHLMRERGFDGLLVAGFRSREMYETYISDDYNEGCVIFPLEGDPVVITWAYLRVMRARWSQERGAALWVADYRVATSGTGVAEVLCEKHLAKKDKKWEGILKGGVYHLHKELGVDESVMWGEYFFVEALEQALHQL